MITALKRFSFSTTLFGVCALFFITNDVYAQGWYDSQGRELSIKGKEVRLKTEKEKRKTLPLLAEEIPNIVRERTELRTDLVTQPIKSNNRFRRSSFYYRNRFGLGFSRFSFSRFNNGIFIRNFGRSAFRSTRYSSRNRYNVSRFRK